MDIADILPGLLVDAPECPDETARVVIVSAARELCHDSLAWNVIQDPQTLVDGQPSYDIDTPDDATPVAVMDVWLGARKLIPKTMSEIAELAPNWQTDTGSEPVWFNSVDGASTMRVFPTPQNAQRAQMTPRTAFMPTLAATTLPDELVNNWLDAILMGARSRLFLQPRKPWSDGKLGDFEHSRFYDSILQIRIKVLHDGAPGTLSVKARPFGF